MTALELLDSWPVPHAAAAVVSPAGLIAAHGPVDRAFRLASVTKPLVARAAQVAVEEGVVELDTPAGPSGSTVRHLLAHASGLAMQTADVIAAPGARRIYSNAGFA
ncbi:serine hydrolase, partial [Mycolicibacterium sp. CBMA 361]|nr:beta-lactamase family protein [Mycolicibacterium sp. CBMA 361]